MANQASRSRTDYTTDETTTGQNFVYFSRKQRHFLRSACVVVITTEEFRTKNAKQKREFKLISILNRLLSRFLCDFGADAVVF